MFLFKPPFRHIAPDGEALPIAKFAVEFRDLFVRAFSAVVMSFIELGAEPRV